LDSSEEIFAFMEQMDRSHPSEPHWYLPMIGVDPGKQGNGYGSALLKHALERCDGEVSLIRRFLMHRSSHRKK
jgi:ribosomal protein S18 acetylase RimI-like enzyme